MAKINYRPLNDIVLVDCDYPKDYAEAKGFTHIVLPEKFKLGPVDPPLRGKVLSTGASCTGAVKVGDYVYLGKWAGAKFPWGEDKRQLVLVKERDLLAKEIA